MAQDDRTPDFEDLLAAFDIPDVPSVPVKEQDSSGGNAMLGGDLHLDTNSHQWSDKSTCDYKSHLQPTSKLTLGVSNLPVKRNNSKPALNLKLTGVIPPKSVPTLTNRQSNKMHIGSNNNSSNNSVTTPPPLTSVNPNNRVLPSTESTDDATYQLSTNVLPPYVPAAGPPEKFKLTLPLDRYRCRDCGDRFLLETSLVQHLQRRSVYITFNCDGCKKTLVYYNRCNLLHHIRTHREKNQPADVKKADVTPIPRELLNVAYNGTSNGTSNTNGVVNAGNAVIGSNHERSSIETGQPRGGKVGVANADGRFRCSECSQFFENASSLEDHFGRSQNMPLATSQCAKCNMTCPSKCSLSAHQRIHLQSHPFICPECGQKVSDYWNAFQLHLSVKCLHYSRTIGYKCSICLMLHGEGESLRQHIITTHSEAYYKCQACPMAFKAGGTFDTHKKTAHLTMDVQCKMIFKCPLCDTVFHSSEQLLEHLDVHIKEQIRATKFVFKCLECGKLVETKMALAEHLKECHPHLTNKVSCLQCGVTFDSPEELGTHERESHGLSSTHSDGEASPKRKTEKSHQGLTGCDECGREFQTGHGYNIHKQRCHNSGNLVCFVCNQRCSSRSQLAAHGRGHQEEGLLVCTVCNNHTFESRNGLARHLDTHAANMKLPVTCEHCGESLSDVIGAAKHLKIEHGFSSYTCSKCEMSYHTIKSLLRHERVMHNAGVTQNKCTLCKEKLIFPKRTLLEKHMKVVHKVKLEDAVHLANDPRPPIKIKINHPDYLTGISTGEDDGLPMKKLRVLDSVDGYVCFKCDFETESQSKFREHIASHKMERSSLQCNECGSCFVVEPSLRKHLMIVHKVKNVDEYLLKESASLVPDGDPGYRTNGSSNTGLECSVCFSTFDSELTLKTHMRTHGMAFIRSKRTKMSDSGSSSS